MHPESGEVYRWHRNGEVEEADAGELERACRELATATLIARRLPAKGRHDFALALVGYMLRLLCARLRVSGGVGRGTGRGGALGRIKLQQGTEPPGVAPWRQIRLILPRRYYVRSRPLPVTAESEDSKLIPTKDRQEANA